LDDCIRILGPHTDAFDLHEWFFALDSEYQQSGALIPQRDGGQWLQARLIVEAQRRGLSLDMPTSGPQLSKQTQRLFAAVKNMKG